MKEKIQEGDVRSKAPKTDEEEAESRKRFISISDFTRREQKLMILSSY